MAKVFVSYSRKDIVFAKRLTAELQKCEFDFWIDWEGIPPTVDWWKEIEKGIEEADVFLFLISPDSAKSKICGKEIDTAVKNGKRIIPIVVREIQWEDTPPQLGHLNYIFFSRDDDFETATKKLINAIQTDYEWAATHRRLQVKALEWERNGKENSFLLRGKDLQDAEFQLATNSSKPPLPTDLQREYTFISRKATDRQRRTTTSIAVGGVVILAVLAVIAVVMAVRATHQATVSNSQLLAVSAQLDKNKVQQNILLSIESMNLVKNYSFSDKAVALRTFRNSLGLVGGIPLPGAEESIQEVFISPDGQWLVTVSEADIVRLLRMDDLFAEPLKLKDHPGVIGALDFSPDTKWLAMGSCEVLQEGSECEQGVVWLWDMDDPSAKAVILHGPRDVVTTLAFSPDGQRLAAGSERRGQNTAFLWDLNDLSRKAIVLEHKNEGVTAIVFSPNGQWLATGSRDDTFRLWRVGEPSSTPVGLDEQRAGVLENQVIAVTSLAFSPDSAWLATVSYDESTVHLWSVKDPSAKPIDLEGHEDSITALAFSPDGQWLATGSSDYTARLWNVKNGFEETHTEPHEGVVRTLAFSPDGQWLATGSEDQTVHLWNLSNPSIIVLRGHESGIRSLAFSADSRQLVTASSDQFARLWDLSNPYSDQIDLQIVEGYIGGFMLSPNGRWLAAGGCSEGGDVGAPCSQGALWIWDMENPFAKPLELHGHGASVSTRVFSPDSQWLATADLEQNAVLWNMDDFSAAPILLHGQENNIFSLVFSPDSQWLAIEARDNSTYLINVSEPSAKPRLIENDEGLFTGPTFSPDGKWLATTKDGDNTVKLWNLSDPSAQPKILSGFGDAINALAFSPDSQWFVTVGFESDAHLWSMKDSFTVPIVLEGDEYVTSVVFSPNGEWLAIGNRLRNMNDSSYAPFFLNGLEEPGDINLVFSPDSQWVAVGSSSQSLFAGTKIWNITSPNTEPIVLDDGQDYEDPGVFSPDGQWFAIRKGEDTIRLWNLNYDSLLKKACELAGRNFSRAEWKRYFPNKGYPSDPKEATCPQWPLDGETTTTPTP